MTCLYRTSDDSEFEKLKRSYDVLLTANSGVKEQIGKYKEEIVVINLRNAKLQKEYDDIQKKTLCVNEILASFLRIKLIYC